MRGHSLTDNENTRLSDNDLEIHYEKNNVPTSFDLQVLSIPKSNSPTLTNVILVEGTSGKIQSTNFPMDYPPLRTQTTHIVGPKGTKIRLRFQASTFLAKMGFFPVCTSLVYVISDGKMCTVPQISKSQGDKYALYL